MNIREFKREEHVYINDEFEEMVKDAIRFLNGTPVHPISALEAFSGAGVYALYYTGGFELYRPYAIANRLSYTKPIYVGKAVPKGWRQSKSSSTSATSELFSRLRDHKRSIESCENLRIEDFACRFVIFEGSANSMISTVEAALINLELPLWNSSLDGFGNHAPGSGRYEQSPSEWDTLHKGRTWATRLNGRAPNLSEIKKSVTEFLKRTVD